MPGKSDLTKVMIEDWLEQALRAIGEGRCPNGHGPLDENGFCMHCSRIGVHYSIENGDTVICRYPEHPAEVAPRVCPGCRGTGRHADWCYLS